LAESRQEVSRVADGHRERHRSLGSAWRVGGNGSAISHAAFLAGHADLFESRPLFAARGLEHRSSWSHVSTAINLDATSPETYLPRIGRTGPIAGRAGR